MVFCRLLISLLLTFPCTISLLAQGGQDFEKISTAQGLSQGLINDMIQDKEGFIWVATKGGLNRFDGYTFKIFANDPQDHFSISSNAISNLLEDSKGRIWISTYDAGINLYNKSSGNFLHIRQSSGLSSDRIESSMAELPDGRILVYPQGGKLSLISIREKEKPVITTLEVPGNQTVYGIGKDNKNFIWIGLEDSKIYVLNTNNLQFQLLYDGKHFTPLINETGKLISAKFSQSFGFGDIPFTRTSIIDSTGSIIRNNVTYTKTGELVINHHFMLKKGDAVGCNAFDLSAVKPGDELSSVYGRNLKTDVQDQNIKCLLLDNAGNLWIGTMGHGIYKYNIHNQRFKAFLSNMSLQRLTIWNNDQIYAQGWRTSKLLSPEGGELNNPVESVLNGGIAYTIPLQSKNGDFWLYWNQTRNLKHFNSNFKLITTIPEPVNPDPTEQLPPLIEDSRQRIWICGANGTLARYEPDKGRLDRFTIVDEQNKNNQVRTQTNAFYEDRNGIFWLGTEHGFASLYFKNDTVQPKVKWYKNIPGNNNSLSYNYVSWFMDDPKNPNYLWICTKGGGLNRMDKTSGNFIHYTLKQGLPNDVVYGILNDKAGNIWGSTNKGIFCMLTGQAEDKPIFRIFSTSDGLQADEFNTNAIAKLSNGNLVFGGVNGLNIFNPATVLNSGFSPRVFITGIQIGNSSITPGDATGVLKETIEQAKAITLDHLQNILTLDFSSLDFTSPTQNQYRYQLSGIDKDWVQSGTRHTATYLHLPPGNFIFRVQGSNSQGVWSPHISELKIKVLPPWWGTWWAYIIYILLIAALIRYYLAFKVNRAKLQSQLNYEQLEAKRVKELDSIKTQLYTNITHEFRTPLTVILGMAQQVIEKPNEQFDTRMDMIVRNGQNLLSLVNQMLDLSKLETGKMTLQMSKGDMIHFLRYVMESFQSLAEGQKKQIHFIAEEDALPLEFDKEKLRQIISNLLSNALKFTPGKGNIYISVKQIEQTNNNQLINLVIKVKDTGIGIPADQLQFVFDRFYRLDNSRTRKTEGTGIGLALTKELVNLMNGEIAVKSPPAGALKGSEFIVTLPLKKCLRESNTPVFSDYAQKPPLPTNNITVLPLKAPEEGIPENAPLILLVEDNTDVVAYTASCLPEYRLAFAKNGKEGYDAAIELIPDLIISDVMMPIMDGFEMVHKLRNNERSSHIPVIMLTAKTDIASKIEGIQQGADVYLGKPFNKDELVVRIKKLLEMRKILQQYYLKQLGITKEELPAEPAPQNIVNSLYLADGFVKKVREAIEQQLTDTNYSVEKLCRQVFMSHSQLHRKLDALTGCSPNKFIRMIRLSKAKEYLQQPNNSIASVALDCGFIDPGYFARVFKQEFGVTPQEWKAKHVNG